MRCLLVLSFFSLTMVSSETVGGAGLFEAWAAAIESEYEDRTVGYATVDQEFERFVASLPQTKRLLAAEGASKTEILKRLTARYKVVLTREEETSKSDQFLGLLYCSMKGLDPFTVAKCREAGTYNLDSVLGQQLFDITIENPWKGFFERERNRKSDSDPFADPFAVQK